MEQYTIKMKYFTDTFKLKAAKYGNGSLAVQAFATEGGETLSINLEEYGLVPLGNREFYVKDYSEGEGLADALVEAGIATKGHKVMFGRYDSFAYLMTLADGVLPEVQ